jgi:hypothetical protein
MAGAPSAPAPHYMNYVSPQPLSQAQSAVNVPPALSGQQLAGQANQTMAAGPSWLNLNNYNGTSNPSAPGGQGGPFDQNLMNQFQNWYQQNQVNPQAAQMSAQNQSQGGGYGSNAAAQVGQFQAEGQQQGFQGALAANQQEYNDVLQGNQSFYQNPVALNQGQNALGIQSGLQQSQLGNQLNMFNSGQANDFNLASAGMANSFNLNPEQNPNALAQQHYGDLLQNAQFNDNIIGNIFGGLLGSSGAFGANGAFGNGSGGTPSGGTSGGGAFSF